MSNVAKLKKKAADLEQKKQFDRAVQAYIELLETLAHDIDDADIPLYNRVGDLLMRQNGAAEALVYYEKAVDLYSERGFLNNAIALCNKILRQSPGRSVIYYKLGKISATKGFKSDAKRNFLEYADRMEKGGRRDEAFRALKEFAELCPDQDDVRLMLAEHLARDNRREEAIEQLQALHAKLETEGRSAEARATLDRMKAIDPDVEPRPSGSFQSVKSNELVFLDIDDTPRATPHAVPMESPPSSRAPEPVEETVIESPHSALDGLTLTFVPDEATANVDSPELLDGFTPTGEYGAVERDTVEQLSGFDTGRAVDADLDLDLPSLIDIPAIEEPAEQAASFSDDTLSESEFDELELEEHDAPAEQRPHDLALPSGLPLLSLEEDVAEPEQPSVELTAADPASDDLTAEIMSPISRSDRVDQADVDEAFALADAQVLALDETFDAADAAVVMEDPVEPSDETAAAVPNEAPLPVSEAAADIDLEPAAMDAAPHGTTPHSLEWEDLAAAAAAHTVEPLELPDAPATPAALDTAPVELHVDGDILDQTPTFGLEEATAEAGFAPGPLFHDTQPAGDELLPAAPHAPLGEMAFEDAALSEDAASSQVAAVEDGDPRFEEPEAAEDAGDTAPPRWRTPPQAAEAMALVDVLRGKVAEQPNEGTLRRRLAEALLETGEREQGLRELDAAMHAVEAAGALETAAEIANEILRLVPESVRHHQKCVEYAVRSGDRTSLIEAYLQLADALFRGGEHAKARAVYSRVVDLEPNEERARAALDLLAEREAPASAPQPAAAEPAAVDAGREAVEDDLGGLDAEVAAAFDAPDISGEHFGSDSDDGNAFATRPALIGGGGGDFIDLGALLRNDQPERSTRMVVGDATPTGDEQADFDDMLRRFKQGVAANVDDEDFDSHYDLGVAFKEMGLIDDAIAQFQKALRSDTHRIRAYEALGQCFVEKGQYQVAVTLLGRAVQTTRVDDRVLVGALYLLGYACEQLRREGDALMYYQRVFAVDVDFRDVFTRIRALESQAVT
jgi:tetratricopeptide (TPR) repeat protein